MLLDPFEEQLHAPSVSIQLGDCLCRCRQIVGQEYVSGSVIGVDADNLTKLFRVIFSAFINRETADSVRDNVLRQPPSPRLWLEPDIGFRPDDKERLDAVNRVKIAEIVVASVEDIVRPFLIRDLRHRL